LVAIADGDRFDVIVVAATLDARGLSIEIALGFGAARRSVTPCGRNDILRTTRGKPIRQAMFAQLRQSRTIK